MSNIIYIKKDKWYTIKMKNVEKIKEKAEYIHILFKEGYTLEIPDLKKHDHRYCVKVYEPEKNYRKSVDTEESNKFENNPSNPSSSSSAIIAKKSPRTPKTPLGTNTEKNEKEETDKKLRDFAGIIFNDSLSKKYIPEAPSPKKNSFINKYEFVDGIPIQKIN
jgi:hypothetical protein